jgi:hypothetical protein
MGALSASTTCTTALVTSGPMPSPGMSVTRCSLFDKQQEQQQQQQQLRADKSVHGCVLPTAHSCGVCASDKTSACQSVTRTCFALASACTSSGCAGTPGGAGQQRRHQQGCGSMSGVMRRRRHCAGLRPCLKAQASPSGGRFVRAAAAGERSCCSGCCGTLAWLAHSFLQL